MSLQDLLSKLHRNDLISPSMVTTIAQHASKLGRNICRDYKTLNAIITRHESLIRKRWLKKSTAQRRAVLLEAWPQMAHSHRPYCSEICENLKEALGPADKRNLPSEACVWPYINLEDLLKPRSLLVFLNARGRNVPFVFALSEDDFSPFAPMSPCGSEPELVKYLLHLSKDPDPERYGCTILVDRELEEYDDDKNGWSYCMRPMLQVLYVQERILSFLVACCKNILHDMSEVEQMSAAVVDEPSDSELELQTDMGHITFAESLSFAPYRNRGSMDFSRLRGYIGSLLTNAKDHLWALREDPSYLSDIILELAQHRSEMIEDGDGRLDKFVDTLEHQVAIVREMVTEA
jgi:hypothetical protein